MIQTRLRAVKFGNEFLLLNLDIFSFFLFLEKTENVLKVMGDNNIVTFVT